MQLYIAQFRRRRGAET